MISSPSSPVLAAALLFLSLLAALACAEDKVLPDYLHICKRNDPNLQDCIKESIETLRPHLATGIPDLNVPSMEPLHLPRLVLNHNPNMRVEANDIKAYQTSSFKIRDLQVDPEKNTFKFVVDFQKMNIEGIYDVAGRILLLPVKGSGSLQLNMTDVSADVDLQAGTEQRDGEEYLTVDDLNVNITVGHGSVRLENLFDGDTILGEVVNAAVNANFDQTLQELKPSVERALETELLPIGQKVLGSVPRRQLFPEM